MSFLLFFFFLCSVTVSIAYALPAEELQHRSLNASMCTKESSALDAHRTLWSIIETCLATIFACVVTSVHPNIPGPEDGRWRKHYRLIGIILLGIFAPELVVTWAGRQFVCARSFTKKMNDLIQSRNKAQVLEVFTSPAPTDGEYIKIEFESNNDISAETNTLASTLLNEESGLHASIKNTSQSSDIWMIKKREQAQQTCNAIGTLACTQHPVVTNRVGSWTLTHSFFAYMGGFMLYRGSERCGIVTAQHIHAELKRSPPRIGPIDITKEEINDMSKVNVLSKGVAVIQIMWFVTRLIARNALSFSITPLEIGTMAFGLLCVLTYVLWMCKPYHAEQHQRLYWISSDEVPKNLHDDLAYCSIGDDGAINDDGSIQIGNSADEDDSLVASFPRGTQTIMKLILVFYLGLSFGNYPFRISTLGGDDIITDSIMPFKRNRGSTSLHIGLAASIIFGLVHLLAWFYIFPTSAERTLWQVSALVIALAPIFLVAILFATRGFTTIRFQNWYNQTLLIGACITLFCSYIAFRIILVVVMFTSLRSLPSSAYDTIPWVEPLPHL